MEAKERQGTHLENRGKGAATLSQSRRHRACRHCLLLGFESITPLWCSSSTWAKTLLILPIHCNGRPRSETLCNSWQQIQLHISLFANLFRNGRLKTSSNWFLLCKQNSIVKSGLYRSLRLTCDQTQCPWLRFWFPILSWVVLSNMSLIALLRFWFPPYLQCWRIIVSTAVAVIVSRSEAFDFQLRIFLKFL